MNVLVIDSGYGGLPVLNALKNNYPKDNYFYIADTANFPYGTKSIEQLKTIINRIETKIDNIDQIYFACNTISSIYYDNPKYKGVIKPVVDYVNQQNYRHVTVFATKNTVNSLIFQSLINTLVFANEKQELIQKIENNEQYIGLLEEAVASIPKESDCLILGCTHFLLIKDEFRKRLEIDVICVDELL